MRDVTLRSLVNNLTFDHLATFKAIVECGSFKGAADRMLMTQPAISQRVKHMEALLGIPLFDRQRGMSATLTPFGKEVLTFADRVLDDLKHFHQNLRRASIPTSGDVITVAAGPSYIKYRLLPVVQNFSDEYPEVDVRLRHSPSLDDVLTSVLKGDAHLGIYPATPPASRVQKFALASEELVLVARPDHRVFALAPEQRLAGLSGIPLALSTYAANSRQLLEAWAGQNDLELRVTIEADNLDTLKEAALQGMALAFLPSFTVEQELRDGRLAAVDGPGLPLERRVFIIIDLWAPPSTSARFFADYLVKNILEKNEPPSLAT